MKMKYKDRIFSKKKPVGDFVFNRKVAKVFDEMLARSVPFYDEMQRMVAEMVNEFAQDKSRIYDLGCSTGATMANVAKSLKKKNVKIIGYDNSLPMLDQARSRLKFEKCLPKCELKIADLNQPIQLDKASVVLLVLTLQFVRPLQREILIKHIYESLKKSGALILVEKILGDDSLTNRLFIDLYTKFKIRNGYSKLEIAQKREALENVLIPYSMQENRMLLRRNGFRVVDVFFNWYNFAGFIAVKN